MKRFLSFLIILLIHPLAVMCEDLKFEMTVYIQAKPEQVWQALVQKEAVSNYYLCPLRKMGSAPGDALEYGTEKEVMISGSIVEFKPPNVLAHTFQFGAASHPGTGSDPDSLVRYEVDDQNGLSKLKVTHSGFHGDSQSYANACGGWPWILSRLKTWLETGKPLAGVK